jgi:hypothetical protein
MAPRLPTLVGLTVSTTTTGYSRRRRPLFNLSIPLPRSYCDRELASVLGVIIKNQRETDSYIQQYPGTAPPLTSVRHCEDTFLLCDTADEQSSCHSCAQKEDKRLSHAVHHAPSAPWYRACNFSLIVSASVAFTPPSPSRNHPGYQSRIPAQTVDASTTPGYPCFRGRRRGNNVQQSRP